ncbi:MAG TPA: NUDIX domain-containing protein [Solirubrobacteraceae bacterium]|jgi:8-oxo-dGTP pyrophosphatase MutT (NUDIX family)
MSSEPHRQARKPAKQPRRATKHGDDAGAAKKRTPGPKRRETSAGGVVVRGEQVVVIVPTRRAGNGERVLALPKGHVDPGESVLQAATREVREETGILAEPVCELGETRYWYRRNGRSVAKTVTFYLFAYRSGDTADHDHEVLEARWIDLREALTALSYEGERAMIERALERLQSAS